MGDRGDISSPSNAAVRTAEAVKIVNSHKIEPSYTRSKAFRAGQALGNVKSVRCNLFSIGCIDMDLGLCPLRLKDASKVSAYGLTAFLRPVTHSRRWLRGYPTVRECAGPVASR